jgi:cytochrome c oxidase assembly protein subunit 11
MTGLEAACVFSTRHASLVTRHSASLKQAPISHANRSLARRLWIFAACSLAFGFALVPLYDVLCDITGYGDRSRLVQASTAIEVPTDDRMVTVEFISTAPSFGGWDFQPAVRAMQVQPGKLYEAKFRTKNLRSQAVTVQAIPDISPRQATQYFQKTECFCFTPQSFEAEQSREFTVRFIIDPKLPANIDRLTLGYAMYDLKGSG